uniref:Red fluorescent protein blFP-O2 n=1 Tax=Branchiostoma lanceolatum TaxID=7740 RepID=B1PNC5_BRALA|nr:red fluorescent protein blFP-O2 [Branchiostoma lanceolatum]
MPLPATHDLHISGSINGHEFDLEGSGKGNEKEGYQELHLKSNKGDLSFSPWILVPNTGYGFYQYLPFPDGAMSPYQAAMHDGSGYVMHRSMQFEDGAMLHSDHRYIYKGNHIKGEFRLTGSGFPADGPVMTNSLTAADWCVDKLLYPNDNTIIGKFDWTYTTTSGKRYQSDVQTNVTFGKPIAADILKKQPMFVFRMMELKHTKTELNFKQWQKAFQDIA